MRRQVVIVGGGYSAAAFAVQLVRRTHVPLDIAIVEPREHVGRGLAYSASDPDHRLNAPLEPHSPDPTRPTEALEWCNANRLTASDPDCVAPGGQVFLRRCDFGAFVSELVVRHAVDEKSGSRIHHVRDVATAAAHADARMRVETRASGTLAADLVVVATGNPEPGLRPPFRPEHARDARITGNPLAPGCLDRIPRNARVLVVGGGLTALDVLSTLVRHGREGEMLVISRRGLRPRRHAPDVMQPSIVEPPVTALPDVHAPIPGFLASAPATARQWLRALRAEIQRAQDSGQSWHAPFDAARNVVWKLWPQLPLQQQRRFLRRLAIWYDVHRFRMPPMSEALVRAAEDRGAIRYAAARLMSVEVRHPGAPIGVEMIETPGARLVFAEYDHIVNCTGLDHATSARANPFLGSLLEVGLLRPHPNGLGFDVGRNCEAIDSQGTAQPRLRVIGPPTAGAFGDPLGAVFIAAQVHRILPDVMSTLAS